jgi:diacylglycerol kinase (ATP)
MNGPFCLVVNPAAGGGRALRLLGGATAALDEAGAAYQVSQSASLEHARDLASAAARRGDVVVAVGGDGLAGALAGAVSAAGGTYGIIPAGRGNDFALVLGLPPGPAAAASVLVSGQARSMDLIGVGVPGQPEAVVALSVYLGVPSVAGEIANRTRLLRGPAVYPLAALRALARWTPAAFRVEPGGQDGIAGGQEELRDGQDGIAGGQEELPGGLDGIPGGSFAAYAVVVANCPYFGGGMKVAPPAMVDDGVLDVVTMRHGPRLAFIRALLKIKDGTHVALPQISVGRAAEVTVTVDRDMLAAADGEALRAAAPLPAGTPLRIRVLPRALRVIAPLPGGS